MFDAQKAQTGDGSWTLTHAEHGEAYHSRLGALTEAESLYIGASGFAEAVAKGASLAVLDVGLGLGYNAIATIERWLSVNTASALTMTSLEIDRALFAAFRQGIGAWQESWSHVWRSYTAGLREVGADVWTTTLVHPNGAVCSWTVRLGDAHETIGSVPDHSKDFIWQDPFSPANNSPLWTSEWFAKVRGASKPDVVLMTYSVAGKTRGALTEAGWDPRRIKATGGAKRQWLKAFLTPSSDMVVDRS